MRSLVLKKDEDRRIRAGHLWVFSNEVDTKKTPLTDFAPGEEATLLDARGKALGSLCVNPASLICGRLHSKRPGIPLDESLLRERLAAALAAREQYFSEPWYRLCHGEGDYLPGLVIDRYGAHLTLQLGTAAMEARRELIVRALEELVHPASLRFDSDIPARGLEGLSRLPESSGPVPEFLEVPENGCRFTVAAAQGQKTGWFYDQRANRREFARYAKGADVLDIFSYVGGFGVTAAAHGARSVTFLDASEPALALSRRNMAANAPGVPVETMLGDAFQRLGELAEAGRRFSLISLDPPAFIKRRKDAAQGVAAYRKINLLAAGLLAPGGVLATSSCSHHLDGAELGRSIAHASAKLGRPARLLYTGAQGPDHPVHVAMPETAYLKCRIVRFD
ncbi:MAG: class I SAM-dependent rRNA methyltransferase [Desulfovibrio sp.]|uniref:class I SAM-dependent rRNA methyltransferase n=1 Tax=Desulfovibrio sp. TaxID=885 RepID=UPI001A7A2CAD|nr:class I SAM-dependent rRNA methyltransferase [Desulfovibrio sp.]MBD5416210.1 class I SAM-dependent rRNA methyltransferase [Desulfovibrio sp.]